MKRNQKKDQKNRQLNHMQETVMPEEQLREFMREEIFYFRIVTIVAVVCVAVAFVWRYVPALHVLVPPVCPFVGFFHVYCPGCGGTRAVYALMRGDILQSLFSNPVVLYIVVLFLEYYIGAIVTLIKKNGRRYYWLSEWHGYGAVILIILFTTIRNLLLIYGHYDYLGDCVNHWMR